MTYNDNYSPIDPDFYDIIDRLKQEKRSGKIFFFNPENKLDEIVGEILLVLKTPDGEYLKTCEGTSARLDKVITIYGKPGPAYDEYDRYANACLTCEDIGQF